MMRGEALEQHLKDNYRRVRIGSYELSAHATRRMLERGIHAEWVIDALKETCSCRPGHQPDTYKYLGTHAMACVNISTKEIITVGYGAFNNPGVFVGMD